MRFTVMTLGCKVNAYESQFYAEGLKQLGYQQVEEGQPTDICIINTCTVTNTAAHKSRQKIHRAKKMNPDAYCVVVGCFVQFATPEQRDALQADLIIGADHKNELPHLIDQMVKDKEGKDVVNDISQFHDFEAMPIHCFETKHRAFLKIEDGCNQFCSYCAIPFARGRERSLSMDQVIQVAKQLVEKGHTEIVLTGIHTGRYHDNEHDLTDVLRNLLKETPDSIFYRISSIEITEITDEFIQLMKENHRICHHLHIPIQSGCNETLKRMNRPYTIQEFKDKVALIRKEIPDVSISTDIIAGFVQESDEEFETTKQNMKDIQFSFLHVFPYSKRDGTKASKMSGEIHGSIVKQRVAELLEISNELRLKDMERFQPVEVLIERNQGNIYSGYTNQYHPIRIESNEDLTGRIQVKWDTFDKNGYHAVWKG